MPGLKLVHMSQHMTCQAGKMSEHTPTKMSEHRLERFPAFMIDDVSEHKPDLMPEEASEHRVNPHKSPFTVGIPRGKVICAVPWASRLRGA